MPEIEAFTKLMAWALNTSEAWSHRDASSFLSPGERSYPVCECWIALRQMLVSRPLLAVARRIPLRSHERQV
jgi:hypothetical protein